MADYGFSKPGEIVVITDSHTTTHGAFGAFGTGVGATDLAVIMATGKLWFMVPKVIRINLTGKLPVGVYAKDVILYVIGSVKADFGVYKAVEFTGPVVKELSISERMALCNMSTEMGCKAAYIQPDEVTFAYLKEHGITDYTVYETDPDYIYDADLTYDVKQLTPQVAVPFSVDNVFPIVNEEGIPVNQAYLGSCTGGRTPDFAIAAKILKGKHIAEGTRMILVPASKKVLEECMEKAISRHFLKLGQRLQHLAVRLALASIKDFLLKEKPAFLRQTAISLGVWAVSRAGFTWDRLQQLLPRHFREKLQIRRRI